MEKSRYDGKAFKIFGTIWDVKIDICRSLQQLRFLNLKIFHQNYYIKIFNFKYIDMMICTDFKHETVEKLIK